MTTSSSSHPTTVLLEDHVLMETNDKKISPAEAFRNKYLTQQHNNEFTFAKSNNNTGNNTSGNNIYYAPLKSNIPSIPGIHIITSPAALQNEDSEEEDEDNIIIFEPKSPLEPKIILDKENNKSSKLLTKLSKSTAPMLAKLSRSKSK